MTFRNDLRFKRYIEHRARAQQRGIEWLFTFTSWWAAWEKSGKWAERGKRRGQYVMARHGDVGPYSPENVSIVTCSENSTGPNECRSGAARGYRFVPHKSKTNPYEARLHNKHLGLFKTKELAIAAYKAARQIT